MNKRLAIGLASFTLLSGMVAGGIVWNKSSASDIPPIVQEVQHQGEELDNHEARITNTENDVKDLQDKTSTPASSSNTSPPTVVTQAPTEPVTAPVVTPDPAPAPAPKPVIVVAFEQVPVTGSEDIDCKLTYSDNTIYQWHWETVTYNQGTKFTHNSGICDERAIGQEKI